MSETTPNPAQGRDEQEVARFVERFALDFSEAGFPRMAARVFVRLLVTDEGSCTAAELARSLQVSAAAISGAVRYLIQVGLVVREREPGSRRDHYTVRDDMWYEAFAQRDEQFQHWENTLLEGVSALGAETAAGSRLDETRRFFEFLRAELPKLMDKWRAQEGREK
ncbi:MULTISPECIES: GbsR/MarR family transcriptional regulator [Actinopolyspora]|uniref:MarR family protein n=1 Tax=Actinopolyspora saharensis TaxID=995062 RepID=A0A1H1GQF3_9ACTN|nr:MULTISPECIES: MarR family transcriptional regulator [Actinopolyspora]NHD16719.1 MarR family transcriptional regulator [Actinopolyspora sp. BKK2]NHE75418.1 MarR family transcriptional regulator [Actinopolyspora sp. BKK1]SDR15432.1 MarR family protein [Actinopolyspora saharensis]